MQTAIFMDNKKECVHSIVIHENNSIVLPRNKKADSLKSAYPFVRAERLELSHLAALDPKSSVSTNSTTPAFFGYFSSAATSQRFGAAMPVFQYFKNF